MARAPRKTALTTSTNPQLERQARRISRQQKQLSKDLASEALPVKLTGATSRALRRTDLKKVQPMTDAQDKVFDAWEDGIEAMVLYGSAGTGKTYCATYLALKEMLTEEPQYDKIVFVRSLVSSREIGHLPGSIEEKQEIYELPFIEIVTELTGKVEAYSKLKESNKVEFHSSSFLRGLTFNNSIIIVDEAQNFSWGELSTIMTRMGKSSRLIICCDMAQNDLVQKKNDVSGLRDFMLVTKNMPEFRNVRFTPEDIVRSGIVKSFIINCEKLCL